jgi:hypothetical protein
VDNSTPFPSGIWTLPIQPIVTNPSNESPIGFREIPNFQIRRQEENQTIINKEWGKLTN